MSFWDSGNLWFDEKYFTNNLLYSDWTAFKRDRPYDSPIWLFRGLRVISWSSRIDPNLYNYRYLQIVFMISKPTTEMMGWTFRIQDSEEEEIRQFISTLIPDFWKNLLST